MRDTLTLLFILSLLCGSKPAYSCINEYGTTINGTPGTPYHIGKVTATHDLKDTAELADMLQYRLDNYNKSHTLEDYSDYAAGLIYCGKYKEAERILLEIEAKKPGLYNTAANIGTLYELTGRDHEAYEWIDKAIKINAHSHEGSEWIHLNILEAKLKGHKNPDSYLRDNNLLRIDFGVDSLPKSAIAPKELFGVAEQLYYQLGERLSFVKPKDPYVAYLIFDLANLAILTDQGLENAIDNYKLAREYGFNDPLLTKRLAFAEEKLAQYTVANEEQHERELKSMNSVRAVEPQGSPKDEGMNGFIWVLTGVLGLAAFGIILDISNHKKKRAGTFTTGKK